jgi:hypothetical protein
MERKRGTSWLPRNGDIGAVPNAVSESRTAPSSERRLVE